jgi:hypothetical protein
MVIRAHLHGRTPRVRVLVFAFRFAPFPFSWEMFFGTARSGQGRAVFARRSEPLTARTVLQNEVEGKGGIRTASLQRVRRRPNSAARQVSPVLFGLLFLLSDCTIAFVPLRQLRSFAVPFFRRKPYIRLQLLQEPIPRAGVAINVQP